MSRPPDPSPGSAQCAACARIASIHSGNPDAFFICELTHTLVFLHHNQAYPGWCVLFLKEHHEHLADLAIDHQAAVFAEVASVAAAVRRVHSPARINYECLGNQMPHVHWHVIPRYTRPADPDPGQTVWVRPAAELSVPVGTGIAAGMILRLRTAMEKLGGG